MGFCCGLWRVVYTINGDGTDESCFFNQTGCDWMSTLTLPCEAQTRFVVLRKARCFYVVFVSTTLRIHRTILFIPSVHLYRR